MDLDRYATFSDVAHKSYEFLSSGPRGTVKKVVRYTEIEPGVFNLGLGDWDEMAQVVRDDIRTNNADRDKVLATVAATVIDFIAHHPKATLFAEGNTPAKSRLYQMGINTHWGEISRLFDVIGFWEGAWERFQRGKNYKAFALKAKEK